MTTAPAVPIKIAFLRKAAGSLFAAIAMTTALSPPSSKSMSTIVPNAIKNCIDKISIRSLPFFKNKPIHKKRLPHGIGPEDQISCESLTYCLKYNAVTSRRRGMLVDDSRKVTPLRYSFVCSV